MTLMCLVELDQHNYGKFQIEIVMNNNNLHWLLEWYFRKCDGDWEHGNGIKIGTIDNPGWYLKINLGETELKDKKFQVIDINRSDNDWIYCSINEYVFEGFGGPFNLPEIIQIFRDWVESNALNEIYEV